MQFPTSLHRLDDGRYRLRHQSKDVGEIEVVGANREEAIQKMTGEIRYRLELCPCSGESYQHVSVEIVEDSSSRAKGNRR